MLITIWVLVVSAGKPLEALPFLKKALDTNLRLNSLAQLYRRIVKSGHFDEAQRLIEDSEKWCRDRKAKGLE